MTVEGVVTADHTGPDGYDGFYLQAAGSGGPADATPDASDGIFVFVGGDSDVEVAIDDAVSVTGVVGEYFGLTQVDASGDGASVAPLAGPLPLPIPTDLPDDVVGDEREVLEGMLVAPTGEYRVASLHELSSFGTVWLSAGDEPLVKNTEIAEPGSAEADAIAASNAEHRILLDDGRDVRGSATEQPYQGLVRTGDGVEFGDLGHVLGYGFDEWRLQPVEPLDETAAAAEVPVFEPLNPRPAAPDAVGGDLSVGAFNVLNYFTTLTTENPDARGARSPEQLAVQRSKIVAAINGLDADVVALMEIENSIHFGDGTPDVALADLVAGLNDAAGDGTWAYVPTPAVLTGEGATETTDVIMNAIIYRTAAVETVGASTTDVDEEVWDNAREPIAQTFAPAGGGEPFTVVANHFKSKGGDGEEPADGQGLFNADRVAQAEAVVEFATELQTASGSDDVAVLGDLNAYSQEDPVEVFTDAGYVDVIAVEAPGEYTYTFDGELGSLDHALLTPSFADRVTGADVWNINSPEWNALEYYGPFTDATSVFRSSDHDPVVFGFAAAAAAATVEIDVLAINDFHGRIERPGVDEGEPVVPSPAEVLDEAVQSFRADNPNTVFVSAGDNIGASTFTSFVQDDNPTLDILDAIGLDASSVGNHEFDRGFADLTGRVTDRADFPYLGANVYDRASGQPALPGYELVATGGVTVGFIGAVTEDLPSLVTPAGIAGIEVRDVVTEVNRVAAALSDGDAANDEADVLVLLVHEGAESDDIAALSPGSAFGDIATGTSPEVDAIVSAHTHQTYNHRLPVEGWPAGLTRPVVQAGQYGEAMDHLTFEVDPDTGEVVAIESAIVDLTPEAFPDSDPGESEVEALVVAAADAAEELGARSLGEITADFNRARQSDGSENRGGESTLGNLVADVQLWATERLGAQIAFMNPGGLRSNLTDETSGEGDPDGNVTYREAANVQPFANTLVTLDLTGAQVVQVLEEQWQPAGASRPFLKLGVSEGLTYTYDPTAPAGQHISAVFLDEEPLDLDATYRVVANSFLASGGDNFATLAEGANVQDSGQVDLQAFVDYMREFSPVSPDLAQRAVGVHVVDEPADGTWAPGDEVTIELSSLLFSGGEQQGSTLTYAVAGGTEQTVPIDATPVDTADDVGRATITVTVPSTAVDGVLAVLAEVEGTGTVVALAVPVDAPSGPTPTPTPTPTTPAPGAGAGGGNGGGWRPSPRPRGNLATTGAEALGLGGLAALLLAGGGALWLTSRRRTEG
ncbi:ExeM/NucH family extracellular endonuclease [Cellulomonas sp. ATA003]|uniref:ExeM/NucH family extracellular endonuclease n=1 Tax=Cellulomonas sp. ATA003 TaxID=3073064 RepID=UPI002873D524|nr:ExeM/NucH family extracellular endonuclease [Cellulomonas sp. ATA003]WNB85401.1 ExeM/NucH family extracellular endonuclease [Cellulomonas sp. ATA003]